MQNYLSDLQKNILKIAFENRKHKKDLFKFRKADVYNREILARVYNFPTLYDLKNVRSTSVVFEPKKIGIKRYNAASAAVSRTFNSLVKRGFAKKSMDNRGITLTNKGRKVAKNLYEKKLNCDYVKKCL